MLQLPLASKLQSENHSCGDFDMVTRSEASVSNLAAVHAHPSQIVAVIACCFQAKKVGICGTGF